MKSLYFIIVFLFTACNIFAKVESKKTVEKSFSATENTVLNLINKYGNTNIEEWDNHEIHIEVTIIGMGRNESDAIKTRDRIEISFNESRNFVKAETLIRSEKKSCKDCSFKINYKVKIPRYIKLDIDHRYGDVRLTDIYQDFKANLSYSKLYGKNFSGNNNNIVSRYSNVNSDSFTNIQIDASYSNISIKSVENINLTTAYSDINFNNASSLTTSSKYDNYRIGNINNLSVSSGYTKFSINNLENSLNISELKYGNLKVHKVADDFSRIYVNGSYSDIKIALTSQHSFKAILSAKYGNIKTGEITFSDANTNSNSKFTSQLNGYTGDKNSKATVEIHSRYGDINLR